MLGISVIASVTAFFIAIAAILKYIKLLKKGYLLDLFNTEDYDVIEPDEENPAESFIKSELYYSEESEEHEKLNCNHIPLDEEACEDDYK